MKVILVLGIYAVVLIWFFKWQKKNQVKDEMFRYWMKEHEKALKNLKELNGICDMKFMQALDSGEFDIADEIMNHKQILNANGFEYCDFILSQAKKYQN